MALDPRMSALRDTLSPVECAYVVLYVSSKPEQFNCRIEHHFEDAALIVA
jgi:hypothetical protein